MDDVARRAAQWGIDSEYLDASGHPRKVAVPALERVLQAISGAREPPPRAGLPTTVVMRQHSGTPLTIAGELAGTLRCRVCGPSGVIAEGSVGPATLRLPDDLPLGTFALELADASGGRRSVTLLVAPPRAYQGEQTDRVFALAAQLYALRSGHDWGIGDFSDLAGLIKLCAEIGAAGLALNPLHALFVDAAERASPYSPNSRIFLNPLYIDLNAVPEFPGLHALGLTAERDRLRASEVVDYRGVAALKERALRAAYEEFSQSGNPRRRRDFEAFCRNRGRALSRFAAFEMLRQRFAGTPWWDWPEPWREPDDRRIRELNEADEVRFHKFVQWLADRQLRQCGLLAKRLKLSLGLFLDVAVGVEPSGADAWSTQSGMLRELTIGAPPDVYNPAGQDWGLAAFNPHQLQAEKFAAFRRTLAAAMRHAGAIRLDHVLGLARLYLIPRGFSPRDGAYVRYPLEALLAVVAQESQRHKCLVVGEDLGTVEENLRASLARWGIWSYRVLMFERESGGAFHPPQAYAENALVTFSTHDLPTFAGWWSGCDLRYKQALGIDPGETLPEREAARAALKQAISAQAIALTPGGERLALLRYLARTPSRLLMISLEDALGLKYQPNLPGTTEQYPNWRRRLPIPLEELAQSEALKSLAELMAQTGRSSPAAAKRRSRSPAT